jgi:hypothetical protein
MKKISTTKSAGDRGTADLRKQYRFDYAQLQPNRFGTRFRDKAVVVLLSDDVAKVFRDGESVNAALRAIIGALPNKRARQTR